MTVRMNPKVTAVWGICSILVVLCANTASAQLNNGVNNINYIINKTIQTPGKKTVADLTNLTRNEISQATTFLDGLGRPVQTIAGEASPDGGDIIQPIEYDVRERTAKVYLPYQSIAGLGSYRSSATTAQGQFYAYPWDDIADDTAPYARTVFENAPSARVVEAGAPGAVWQPGSRHTTSTVERSNASNEGIKKLTYNLQTSKPYCLGTYASTELAVTQTTDEHKATTLVYTNSEGQIVAKKSHAYNTSNLTDIGARGQSSIGVPTSIDESRIQSVDTSPYYVTTYYVYDELGSLRTVIQPEGIKKLLALSD